MKSTQDTCIVLVTAPDLKVARELAQEALQAKQVACANLIPTIESHYWWQGNLESADETLILFKTTRQKLEQLQSLITTKHPYDTPEFVVVRIEGGAEKYLEWIRAMTNAG